MQQHIAFAVASQQLLGKFILDNNKLRPTDNKGQIIHIRERAQPKGNSRYFLAYHSPTFQYISNLYPTPTIRDSLAIGDVKLDHKKDWYIDDNKGNKYKLTFDNNQATISQFGGHK